ncbi:MAG: hypothetical protein GY765_31205 [bacterium]|nr:hypothetical protein [bacterium]
MSTKKKGGDRRIFPLKSCSTFKDERRGRKTLADRIKGKLMGFVETFINGMDV